VKPHAKPRLETALLDIWVSAQEFMGWGHHFSHRFRHGWLVAIRPAMCHEYRYPNQTDMSIPPGRAGNTSLREIY